MGFGYSKMLFNFMGELKDTPRHQTGVIRTLKEVCNLYGLVWVTGRETC